MEASVTARANRTGLPDGLKSGVERLSGVSLDDVQVSYNSHRPAAIQAHAYTQGSQIYVGPGQEPHLAHETWHVVQQKQGRVRPTLQAHGVVINDDAGLEAEADRMGARALASPAVAQAFGLGATAASRLASLSAALNAPAQRLALLSAALNAPAQRRADAVAEAAACLPTGAGVVQRDVVAGFPAAAAGPFARFVNAMGQTVRAPWIGHWAPAGAGTAALAGGQSRNHVISHHHILESLTNLLNTIYNQRLAAPGAAPAAVAQLTNVTNSLFPAGGVPQAAMALARTNVINAIYASVGAAPGALAGHAATMSQLATTLESHLTSSPDNVRAGDANMNLRIGNNIDAQYAGHVALPAYAAPTPAFLPAGLVVPTAWTAGAAHWGAYEGGAAVLGVGTQFYCMTPAHNQIVWNFMTHATPHMATNLTVVRNDDPMNMVGGYTGHSPLSSSGDPAPPGGMGAGAIVLIFDPAGVARPRRFA